MTTLGNMYIPDRSTSTLGLGVEGSRWKNNSLSLLSCLLVDLDNKQVVDLSVPRTVTVAVADPTT